MNYNRVHSHQSRRFAVLLVLLSFLFFTPAAAQSGLTRYVAPTGNDANNDCLAVRNPCATLAHAISQADPGDTIRISPGVYTETNIWIDKSLTIAGQRTTDTILQGAETMAAAVDPILIIDQDDMQEGAAVTVQNLTIRHGASPPGSQLTEGAITVGTTWGWSPASLTLVGVAVEANQGNGIGIGYGGVLTLRRSRVNQNQGNGVSGYEANISMLESSEIAANGGHGVRFDNGGVVIEWSVIRDNSYGGVENSNSSWSVGTSVRNSRILGNGGWAVSGEVIQIYVADTVISGNGGGLLVYDDGRITVSNSVIRGNQGDGIMSEDSATYVSNSVIESNQGDGIDHENNQWQLNVSGSTIRDNSGYGLTLWQTWGFVSDTTISGNRKGGLYVDIDVQLDVSNSSIIGNRSSLDGGGVVNQGDLTLVNTVISQNRAGQHGGGIYSTPGYPSHLELIGVTVTQNYADTLRNNAGNGGGIYNQDWVALTLLNTILTDNYDLSPAERHPNCSGGLTSLGGNTFGDLTGCTVMEE